jgi:predicted metalloenzyme YecM
MNSILSDYILFLDALFNQISAQGIDPKELLMLDHLAYRVESIERYEELKAELSSTNELASEAEINGRPICVFKLSEPLPYKGFEISALELPAPSSTPYTEGLEHAEFVIENLEEFMAKHSNLEFITKDIQKKINPEIALKLDGCSAKFHLRDILEVVKLQEATGEL